MKYLYLCLFTLAVQLQDAVSQDKYWVTFSSKDTVGYQPLQSISQAAIHNRNNLGIQLYQYTDVPVSKIYIEELKFRKININYTSKWLNAVSANMTENEKQMVQKLSFVSSVTAIDERLQITSTNVEVHPTSLHKALEQMNGYAFSDQGITGKDVKVGVIDAGFFRAHVEKDLAHLFSEFRIIMQKDFQNPERMDLITESKTNGDGHGKSVLQKICGYDADLRIQNGLAVNAKFYLARTEDGDHENRGEEDKWIAAMEWLDSLGVRLISTSLGYSSKMDDPNDNYLQTEMDGKTTKITKAAQIAVDQKGIFLVVSAGNEGASTWRIISSPADAAGALTVGAMREHTLDRIGYSSIGPEFLPYLKPEVACYSPNGTSFSAPSVTGFVACMMEKNPKLTNKELKSLIIKGAHLYPFGNNYVGYGAPQADRVLKLIADSNAVVSNTIKREIKGKKIKYKIPDSLTVHGIMFYKKSPTIVVKQVEVNISNRKLKLRRQQNITNITLSLGNTVIEFVWK